MDLGPNSLILAFFTRDPPIEISFTFSTGQKLILYRIHLKIKILRAEIYHLCFVLNSCHSRCISSFSTSVKNICKKKPKKSRMSRRCNVGKWGSLGGNRAERTANVYCQKDSFGWAKEQA